LMSKLRQVKSSPGSLFYKDGIPPPPDDKIFRIPILHNMLLVISFARSS
jgi:hypothetical protein